MPLASRLSPLALTLAFGAAMIPGRAWAICPADSCAPDPGDDCYNICTPVTVGGLITVVCDLDVTETTDNDAYATAVNSADGGADICGSGDYYCAWGQDTSGRQLYCGWGTYDGDLVGVNLKGGEGDDALSFLCEESTNPLVEARLQEYAEHEQSLPFLGRIDGAPGNDTIIGSTRASDHYADALYGWGGADDIASHEGNDYIDAGGGPDRVCSGPGDDLVNAGSGNDDVVDQAGSNTLNGGPDDDDLQGNSGDTTDGGPGSDRCDPSGTSCTYTSPMPVLHTCPT